MPKAIVVGAGHNGLVASLLLAQQGLEVTVLESRHIVGGACVTERPFPKAPELQASTGAYLLGLMPPELAEKLELDLPLIRRDPHYFLPTTGEKHLLLGSDEASNAEQLRRFFSEDDVEANEAMNAELASFRDDLAPAWLAPPLSLEDTAERYIRPALREPFVRLCRGTARNYLERFGFRSDLLKAMYAVTDAFSGLDGGYDTPGTGMNLLIHNMCRLPGAGGTWMIVKGGMGEVTRQLAARARKLGARIRTGANVASIRVEGGTARGVVLDNGETLDADVVLSGADPFSTADLVGKDALPTAWRDRLEAVRTPGLTMKVNLALRGLPTFTCLPEDRGQFGPTIHLLPDGDDVLGALETAHRDARAGRLPRFPSIEWYFHTPVDPSLQDPEGRHGSALFVQWVPHTLDEGSWEREEGRYVKHLLSLCDRFAPGTSDLVDDVFALTPPKIEQHFGMRYGHIHHVDNKFGFDKRMPYETGIDGLLLCGAGCHPAGSVIGAAGHNGANEALRLLDLPTV